MEDKEKQTFERSVVLDYAALAKVIVSDLQSADRRSRTSPNIPLLKKYDKEMIRRFLDSPQKFEKQLREISKVLYDKSPHYKRMIKYFANMALLHYVVEPYGLEPDKKVNTKTFKSAYYKVINFLDVMNIRHELLKAFNIAWRDDVYYGYEWHKKDSYFIQKLDPDLCCITSIEDGVYNFSFDFQYFDAHKYKLEMYPPEFTTLYNKYLQDEKNFRWQELSAEKTICIKINEDVDYVVPPFVGVFEAIFDLEVYKSLRKQKEQIGNYKVLIQKLPVRDSEHNNDFMIEFNTMMDFHNRASQALPEDVGLITSPMDIKDISFTKDIPNNDNVTLAQKEIFDAGGISHMLLGGDSSSIGLDKSIKADEELVFTMLRQAERWLNRRLRSLFTNNNYFRVNLMNITIFNEEEVFNRLMQAASTGLPVKMMLGASVGLTPSAMLNMAFLENDVLDISSSLVPLISSAHGAATDQGGRPQKSGDQLSSEGLKTRDQGKNKSRA